MKKLVNIIIIIILSYGNCLSQTFEKDTPDHFATIGYQVDLFGSLDKEGINSVINTSVVAFDGVFEFELQIQSIINKEKPIDNYRLTYIDALGGFNYRFLIGSRMDCTVGAHGGWMARPSNIVDYPDATGWTSYLIYGPTTKGRLWLGKNKMTAIVISGSYDYAPDVAEKWGRINGRAGMEFRLY